MKNFKLLYLFIAGAFLLAFFGCGGGATTSSDNSGFETYLSSGISPCPDTPSAKMSRDSLNLEAVNSITDTDGCYTPPIDSDNKIICDINDDGKWDLADVVALANVLQGKMDITLEKAKECNFNVDKVLDGLDLAVVVYLIKPSGPALKDIFVNPPFISGDVNEDGETTLADVILSQKLTIDSSARAFLAADVNLDWKVDRTDTEYMADYLLKGNPVTYLPWADYLTISLEGSSSGTSCNPKTGIYCDID